MSNQQQPLEDLHHIKQMMERKQPFYQPEWIEWHESWNCRTYRCSGIAHPYVFGFRDHIINP